MVESPLPQPRPLSPEAALAALAWQLELGASEAICEAPQDRMAAPVPEKATETVRTAPAGPAPGTLAAASFAGSPAADPAAAAEVAVAEARAAAAAARSLPDLAAAMAAYPHCELRRGARNCVFADGNPEARVMVIGEAPGREEDLEGRPFVGRAGQLLDRMFAAIGMARTAPDPARAIYITNVLPWRPPQNRTPDRGEIEMLLPFLLRHIELAAPEVIVLMGNTPCAALLGQTGITRLRGRWVEVAGRPALPSFHPAYLLRNPAAKRESWADLLALQARLRGA